ncbi:MAG: glycosyltransferase family 2 protein [Candidatus Zixiibacteriota bacterium]
MKDAQEHNEQIERPLVSVVVPVFNGERYLDSALQSIFEQDYHPFEVIVVDDGSVDGSADVARSFDGIRYMYQTNRGNAAALNVGIEAARGEFIAFLDADDIWVSNKLRVQVEYLIEQPHIGGTISKCQNFLEPGLKLSTEAENILLEREQVAFMTLVARRTVFEQVGGFDPGYKVGIDFDWIIRAREAGIVIEILPEILLHRRIHDSNLCSDVQAIRSSWLRMVKASIGRRGEQISG